MTRSLFAVARLILDPFGELSNDGDVLTVPRIEQDWDAFLGRAPRPIDERAIRRKLQGTTVAVTGAGGFIGSALARELVRWDPAHLILLDSAERGLHDLERSFDLSKAPPISYELVVGDVCHAPLLNHHFSRSRPQIVIHAAALKHVGLMETNPVAAARTNILGTRTVFEAAAMAGSERFVLVSTDKAVEPTSLMGATKRIAELLVSASDGRMQAQALRLGNVLGSTGSVVPILEQQIAAGSPLTITDRDCMRYFFSIREVLQHLLSALIIEAPASILVPQAGAPRRVMDLARFLVERAGRDFASFGLTYSGLRPGEKLEEALIAKNEHVEDTDSGDLRMLTKRDVQPGLHASMTEVEQAVASFNVPALLHAISEILPDYQPSSLLLRCAETWLV